jgi:lipoprotein-anchoring transpeptidase ErfK/SrfK
MSHGCVNLPTDFAAWLWDWATVGTPVEIIAG